MAKSHAIYLRMNSERICGSPIRSNGGPEARLAQLANRMRDGAAIAFCCS